MQGFVKWTVRTVVVLLGVVAIAVVVVYVASQRIIDRRYPFTPRPLAAAGTDVSSGAKLVRLFGCDGCHAANLRGQVLADVPVMFRLSAPNLTLAAWRYSDAQLATIIRSGVRPDGRAVVFMPSEAFSRLSDPEVTSVIAYVRSRPAGGAPHEDTELRLLGRILLLTGNISTEPAPALVAKYAAHPLPDFGPATVEGRGIARACAQCHGPDLSGGVGPDLRIAAAYDLPAFERLLRTGVGLDGRPVRPVGLPEEDKSQPGLMAQIAPAHFGGLSDAEVSALHDYLQARAASLQR